MCDFLKKLFGGSAPTIERPSPKIRIKPEQVHIVDGTLQVTGLSGCFIAAIAPTNSMESCLDDGMFVVLDPTVPYSDLVVGDIIWFEHPDFKAIHRIIEIGSDPAWFCKTKGDNNSGADGVKIRSEHIKGVWRGTVA